MPRPRCSRGLSSCCLVRGSDVVIACAPRSWGSGSPRRVGGAGRSGLSSRRACRPACCAVGVSCGRRRRRSRACALDAGGRVSVGPVVGPPVVGPVVGPASARSASGARSVSWVRSSSSPSRASISDRYEVTAGALALGVDLTVVVADLPRLAVVLHDPRVVDREVVGAPVEVVVDRVAAGAHDLGDEQVRGLQRPPRVVDEPALDLVPRVAEPVALLGAQVPDVELLAALAPLGELGLGGATVARRGHAALVLGPEMLLQLRRAPPAGQHHPEHDEDQQDEDDQDDHGATHRAHLPVTHGPPDRATVVRGIPVTGTCQTCPGR